MSIVLPNQRRNSPLLRPDGTEYKLYPIRKAPHSKELLQYLPRWMSNDSPDDLGIVRFGFELFPSTLKREYGMGDWVRPALYQVLKYNTGDTKVDRCHAICTYREGAKSTWFGKILPLYFMLIGQYGIYHRGNLLPEIDYIRLRAKNVDDAEKKLERVTMEFGSNRIINLFGRLEPTLKETKDKKLKNTSKFVILLNGYIFQALGLNQPARGANIKDRRPKLDIDDDVENKENTKTDMMREYNAKEVLGEQFAGLDKEGITIYIGNFVHSECIMKYLQQPDNTAWKKHFSTITRVDEEGNEIADWEKRFPISYVRSLEDWYNNPAQVKLGGRRTFFMEYYNRIVTDKDYKILYFDGEYEYKNGHNFIVKERNVEGQYYKEYINAFIVVSIDPAISTEKKSSDGVVTVTAFCSDNKRRIIDLSLAKFDIRDRYFKEEDEERVKSRSKLAITPEDIGLIRRRGGVEEVVRKILKFKADAFVSENAGQQLAWYNDIRDLLSKLNIHIPGLPYHPTDDKVYKLETGLLNLFAASLYEIKNDIPFKPILTSQIETFPDNKKDILDALHNAEKIGRIPEALEVDAIGRIHGGQQQEIDEELDEILDNEDIDPFMVLP